MTGRRGMCLTEFGMSPRLLYASNKGKANVPLPLAIPFCRRLMGGSVKDVSDDLTCPEADAFLVNSCLRHFAARQIQFSLKLYNHEAVER